MAALTVTKVPIDGGLGDVAGAAVAADSDGDTAPVGPGRFFYVANGGGSPVTVTITTPGTVKGLAVEDMEMTVGGGDHGIIPLPRLAAGANGRASISYSVVTSVTVAVLELES